MKSLLKQILSSSLALLCLVSCGSAPVAPSESSSLPPAASHEPSTEEASSGMENTAEPTGSSTESGTEKEPAPDKVLYPNGKVPASLKILAIGNSFSVDSMEYLYQICKSAGVKEVILGNLYIGGCSIATHYSNAISGAAAYTYYKNTTGNWVTTKGFTLKSGIEDEKWDYISFQQTSKTCGLASTHQRELTGLVEWVDKAKTNPDAKFMWHMTWAYQQDSTHSAFVNYDHSQEKMYRMTVDVVQNTVMKNEEFDLVIPAGTAIQNARTSFTGDTLTRDGYHLNKTLGRYIAGLSWYAAITKADLSAITYSPSKDVTEEVMKMAKEAAENAEKTPYAVTKSTFTEGTWNPGASSADKFTPVNPEDCFEADKALAKTIGIDLDKYEIFEYEYIENGYYYCTKGSTVTYPKESGSTYKQNICTKKIYSKEEIPENSIIICDEGWQFRPELWVSLTEKAASRPAISTARITRMDASFWGASRYFAFNISSNPKVDISAAYAAAASHVRIYIPKG